jgi:hypothetical protein
VSLYHLFSPLKGALPTAVAAAAADAGIIIE